MPATKINATLPILVNMDFFILYNNFSEVEDKLRILDICESMRKQPRSREYSEEQEDRSYDSMIYHKVLNNRDINNRDPYKEVVYDIYSHTIFIEVVHGFSTPLNWI